ALLVQRTLRRDARALHLLARLLLTEFDQAAALDLKGLHGAFAVDSLLLERALRIDAHLLDLLASLQLGMFGIAVTAGALARELGTLGRAPDLHLALLLEAGVLAVPIDL